MRYASGDLIEKYILEEMIGEGGEAEVWRAHSRENANYKVAIKLRPPVKVTDREEVAKQRRQFNDENSHWLDFSRQSLYVVTIHDLIFEVTGDDYVILGIVTEYSHLGDLHTAIESQQLGTYLRSEVQFIYFLLKILAAVKAGQAAQKNHSDIKPKNILLFRDDNNVIPKLTDFGISRTTWEPVKGLTPGYSAPELQPGKMATEQSDVYSLGITFYEIFYATIVNSGPPVRTASSYHSGGAYKQYLNDDLRTRTARDHFSALPYFDLMALMTDDKPENRPTLEQVTTLLNRSLQQCLLKGPQYEVKTARDQYLWNPNIHALFQEDLYYLLIRGGNPILDVDEILSDLRRDGAVGFSLRTVSGGWDYIVRVWAQPQKIEAIRAAVGRNHRKVVVLQVRQPPSYQAMARKMVERTEIEMLKDIERHVGPNALRELKNAGYVVQAIIRSDKHFRVTLLVSTDATYRSMSGLIGSALKEVLATYDSAARDILLYEVEDLKGDSEIRVLITFIHSDFIKCRLTLLSIFRKLSGYGNFFRFSTLFDLGAPSDVISDDGSILTRIAEAHATFEQ